LRQYLCHKVVELFFAKVGDFAKGGVLIVVIFDITARPIAAK
jgi:hypothetical protein